MIYAELKHILSPDISDLSSYFPDDPESFGFSLQLLIGPKDQVGEESFQVTVCTPQWLSQQFPHDQIVIGCHYLIVFEYNLDRLINRISLILQLYSGETWQEVAMKISRIAYWEFEDYKG
ncbi:MAG: immunity 8 family protein [Anaerolineae bacterium]|nr:immunity 8 family protein [Anaerolineae bacterium]